MVLSFRSLNCCSVLLFTVLFSLSVIGPLCKILPLLELNFTFEIEGKYQLESGQWTT